VKRPQLKSTLQILDKIGEWQGKVVSILIFVLIFIILYEVISRYVFNSPTNWVHEVSTHIFGAFFILGGAYTLHLAAHVNVDVLYSRLSPRGKAITDLITWCLFYFFILTMMVKGFDMALKSWAIVERSQTPFAIPIYPIKTVIPIGAFLMLLMGLKKTARDVITIIGKETE